MGTEKYYRTELYEEKGKYKKKTKTKKAPINTYIQGFIQSTNWPSFTVGQNSILNCVLKLNPQSFKSKNKNVIKTV